MMERFLIWGTGDDAVRTLLAYKRLEYSKKAEIVGFIDNDKEKCKELFGGYQVFCPEQVEELSFDYISIASTRYYDDIKSQILVDMKIPKERLKNLFYYIKDRLLDIYKNETKDCELSETLKNIKNGCVPSVYNFKPNKVVDYFVNAFFDESCDMYYSIMANRHRLYYKKGYPILKKNGKLYVTPPFLGEQDLNSPHLYLEGEIQVKEGDVLVEAGACEAIFALEHIDKVSKLFLIECSPEWMEALRKTFEPFQDKVVFCMKLLGAEDSDMGIRLDTLLKNEREVNFIKMDIEGKEVDALLHAGEIIRRSNDFRCSICAYHKHGDEVRIRQILQSYGCSVSVSHGYMWFLNPSMVEQPELRRGIVRGLKKV